MRTKRISRQLKKVFGVDGLEDQIGALAPDSLSVKSEESLKKIQQLVEKFPQFLDVVEESYQQLEERVALAQRSMEVSASELTDSNSRLFSLNQTFNAMVNSLDEGFLIFGRDGICLEVYSLACERLLETCPSGKHIGDVLGIASEKRPSFDGWLEILFQEKLDFADFCSLGPNSYSHSKGNKISLQFKPVRDAARRIDFIVAIANDFTREFEAAQRADEMKAQAVMVTSILKNRERFTLFVSEFRAVMENCTGSLLNEGMTEKEFLEVRRHIHALKGASGTFGMLSIQNSLHSMETEIAKRESMENSLSYLREEIAKTAASFEEILRENSEILGGLPVANGPQRDISLSKLIEIEQLLAAEHVDRHAIRQKIIDEMISVPCSSLFQRFNLILQEAASRLGKVVGPILISGEDVRLVPERYANLFLDLGHVFRNIVDHGIENVGERRNSGKPREGAVSVELMRSKEFPDILEICISDDGRGVNLVRVRSRLREMGRLALAESGSREEILDSIFLNGLSTAQVVSEISGRGIGLESVRASLAALGGSITVESMEGVGTRFLIRLPVERASSKGVVAGRAA